MNLMPKATLKSGYAVQAPAELALAGRGARLSVREIARRQGIPPRFLERIFCELRRSKLLDSRRGSRGGYSFAMPPEEIPVLDVVEILDGELGTRAVASREASKVWEEADEAFAEVLGHYSIARIAAEERSIRRRLPG
jgi:Rrf2 family protein